MAEPGEALEEETTVAPVSTEAPGQKPLGSKNDLLPVYVFTALIAVVFLFGPLFVPRGPNAGITKTCIMLSAFCCWIFWIITYILQMNPLLGPRLDNGTLAWIGHKWGKDPKKLSLQSL